MLVVFRFVRFTDGCDVLDGMSGRWRIAMDAAVLLYIIVLCGLLLLLKLIVVIVIVVCIIIGYSEDIIIV